MGTRGCRFSERIPELAAAVKKIIDEEYRRNPAFVRRFDDFYGLCRSRATLPLLL
jgi:hypothetical protein